MTAHDFERLRAVIDRAYSGSLLGLLRRRAATAIGSGRRSAHEHLFSVEILNVYANTLGFTALGLIREDLDLGADRQACFRDAVAEEIGRGAALDTPGHRLPVVALHVHPDP